MQEQFTSLFDVVDRATRPLAQITRAFEGGQLAIAKTTSLLNPLNAALGLIGAGLSFDRMLDIGSKFENQTLKMAQTAKLMGIGGETFATAMETAKGMIQQVNVAAAALPGEAEDYTTALEMAGFTVNQATGDYQKTFGLIKDITAITISNQRSAAEGASQLNKMLNADRGLLELQNDYSMKLIQNMRAIPGYVNLTTTSFNNMKLAERVQLVEKLSGTYKDMIDQSSNTLDAIKGASMTMFKEITRQATAPLFDGWKEGLKAVNALFMQADGALTPLAEKVVHIGNVLSTKIVEGAKSLGELSMPQAGALLGGLGGLGGAIGAGGLGGAAAVLAPLVLVGETLGKLATDTEFLDSVFVSINQTFEALAPIGSLVVSVFDRLSTQLAEGVSIVLPAVLDSLARISAPVVWLAQVFDDIGRRIAEQLAPTMTALWIQISIFARGVGDFVVPLLKGFGFVIWKAWEVIEGPLVGSIRLVIRVFGQLFEWVGKFLSWAGEQLNWAVQQTMAADVETGGPTTKGLLQGILDAFRSPEGGVLGAPKAPVAPNKRAQTGMVQDFRFSRFEISQKFEEGYDPDRIAVAFANDLGKLGEQRSQSAFAPLFSVGI
jgi:hypothetical protein